MTRSHPESYAAPCIGSLHSRQKRRNISVSGSCTTTTSGLSLFISTPSKYKTQVVSQHMNPPHDLYVSIACRILRFELFSRTCRQWNIGAWWIWDTSHDCYGIQPEVRGLLRDTVSRYECRECHRDVQFLAHMKIGRIVQMFVDPSTILRMLLILHLWRWHPSSSLHITTQHWCEQQVHLSIAVPVHNASVLMREVTRFEITFTIFCLHSSSRLPHSPPLIHDILRWIRRPRQVWFIYCVREGLWALSKCPCFY